jgi:hypothetical protein
MEALTEGQIFYALRVDSQGNALADLTIWRTGHEWFEVMSGRREDVADLLSFTGARLDGADMSGDRSVFAIPGPASLAAMLRLGVSGPVERLRHFYFCGISCARSGAWDILGADIGVTRRHARDLARPAVLSRPTPSESRLASFYPKTSSVCLSRRRKPGSTKSSAEGYSLHESGSVQNLRH